METHKTNFFIYWRSAVCVSVHAYQQQMMSLLVVYFVFAGSYNQSLQRISSVNSSLQSIILFREKTTLSFHSVNWLNKTLLSPLLFPLKRFG